jgi:hypothetical protein
VNGQFDTSGFTAMGVETHPGTSQIPVEAEFPLLKSVGIEQLPGQFANACGPFREAKWPVCHCGDGDNL